MRLAFVAQPFDRMDPPVRGGSLAIWIYQIARRCAARGHETFVFGNHGGSLTAGGTRHENVNYIFTPTSVNQAVNRVGERVAALLGKAGVRERVPRFAASWRDWGYAREVARRIRYLRCDSVLVMNYSQFVPVIRRHNPQARIHLYMQCEWLTQLDPGTIRERAAMATLLGGCSDYITRLTAAKFPEFRNKCVTVRNAASPVDVSYASALEPGHILFVGRVSPEKGIHVLVDAFHDVLKRFPQARLHIAGGIGSAPLEFLVGLSDDPDVAALKRFYERNADGAGRDPYFVHLERAAGQELGRTIFFEGRVDHDQVSGFYRRASILVNPSLSESFGMSLVEAMMHSVPVVASRIGGMPYIVNHGETGFLVDAADHRSLAKAICDVLSDEAACRRMGEAGRERALKEFSWERSADTLLEQFEAAR